ncbi:MAG: DUF952 domain-containing protein [Pseudomonadota bacterium]
MSDVQTPAHVYRLVTQTEWRESEKSGVVPLREIDRRDGYIHLSTRSQVLETARLHFAGADDLLALKIARAPFGDAIKFELAPKRGEAFPHLYGVLRRNHVSAAIRLVRVREAFAFGDPL